MRGDKTAEDKVEIHQSARVVGNIVAPRIVIAEGARFKGHIDMTG
jgi:cytoskeletal protein CcmA (bactofilin family)